MSPEDKHHASLEHQLDYLRTLIEEVIKSDKYQDDCELCVGRSLRALMRSHTMIFTKVADARA
jgi:hypothetical protein